MPGRVLHTDGSVTYSPETLTLLEQNWQKQSVQLTRLGTELLEANSSLTELRTISGEQRALLLTWQTQWNLIADRLSDSDQYLAWAMEDVEVLETVLAQTQTRNTRLETSTRFWRTVAIVVGCLAVGAGVAAVVW
jgi:chromosome segregation ATPase